jgi:hypothetical protein
MALTSNPIKIVTIAPVVMWRKDEWKMAMLFENCCRWSVTGPRTIIERGCLPHLRDGGGPGSTFDPTKQLDDRAI